LYAQGGDDIVVTNVWEGCGAMSDPVKPVGMPRREWLGRGAAATGWLALEGLRPSGRARAAEGSPPAAAADRALAEDRIERACRLRSERAQALKGRPPAAPARNGDESRHPTGLASFTKGLPHDALGHVDPGAFDALVRAAASGRSRDFEAVPLAGGLRLVNPQAAYGYGLEGMESAQVAMDPPPAFDSAETAAEACELYWQALTRDVPFAAYDKDPLVQKAAAELSRKSGFRGPRAAGSVTPATLFRGDTAGDLAGPYVSQFLWKEVPYGAIRLVQQVRTATPGLDYLVAYEDWLAAQNGAPTPPRHGSAYRYVRSGRDLAAYVHLDFTYQAFLTACLILFGFEGTTDAQRVYRGAPWDAGNPYRGLRGQTGFVTFGVAHVLDLVARVSADALRACWYCKWPVHRRLRPEELGGRVHNHRTKRASYPLHDDILGAAVLDEVFARHGTYLLPQAYPEGAPLHPAYPSGHAAIAGACTTVLKAFFDESFPIDDPVVASADGLRLFPYGGKDLTVGGELDKLAANVAIGRNAAGIHWRSDAAAGLRLGEAVALALLADLRAGLHEETDGLSLTRFDGSTVRV
jgi:membrane-associated phospholipid phosphatase